MAEVTRDKDIFIKTPKGIAVMAPLIIGVMVIIICALIGIQSNSSVPVFFILIVAIAIVWLLRTKIWFAIGSRSVVVRAPMWRREIPFGDIAEVEVRPDDGTNFGAINWPVTTNKKENLTRLNLGGEAKVVLRIVEGARGTGPAGGKVVASELRDLEFVTSTVQNAEEIATKVRAKQQSYLDAR